jgi:hypothetical protein
MAGFSVDLRSADVAADGAKIVRGLSANENLAGKRGESCALVASNLIGAWNMCIAALAGKGAGAGAGAEVTAIDLLDADALRGFGVSGGDEATATACAKSASGILSQIFADAALARLLANYARGNDAGAAEESDAAVAAFSEAYGSLTKALKEKETSPAAPTAAPTAAPATPP